MYQRTFKSKKSISMPQHVIIEFKVSESDSKKVNAEKESKASIGDPQSLSLKVLASPLSAQISLDFEKSTKTHVEVCGSTQIELEFKFL